MIFQRHQPGFPKPGFLFLRPERQARGSPVQIDVHLNHACADAKARDFDVRCVIRKDHQAVKHPAVA